MRMTRWLAALVVLLLGCAHPGGRAPSAASDELSSGDLAALWKVACERLDPQGPNLPHVERLVRYAPALSAAHGARLQVVQAAAILHDATKEKGEPDRERRFCGHGDDGARLARDTLVAMGKSEALVEAVAGAVREHMGPLGVDPRAGRPRFLSRACEGWNYPAPSTPESEVLYDLDMLDLMSVEGVLKVVKLRQAGEGKGETLRQSAESASQSALEARQTLYTPAGRGCGAAVEAHAKAFVDCVDWQSVSDLAALESAVRRHLEQKPLPGCLAAAF